MRHYASVVLVAVILVGAAAAADAQNLTAGAKIGLDTSSLPMGGTIIDQVAKQPSTETSSKLGALIGGFVTIPVWEQFSFQPELQFVTKGVQLTEADNGGTITASLRYLEFPMLARYALPIEDEHWKGYVMLGPTFAVKASTSAQLNGPSKTVDLDIDPAIRTFDAGLAFAGGAEWDRYFAELRYTLGLTDVGTEMFPHGDAVRNRSFAVAGGIRFK